MKLLDHHTKNKGDYGVLKAQLDLFEKGYMILSPQTEHAPFDLVIYKAGKFLRVQVKYRELKDKGVLNIRFSSCYSSSKKVITKEVNKEEIDLYCIYCPQTDEYYYLDPKKYSKSLTLRLIPQKTSNFKM